MTQRDYEIRGPWITPKPWSIERRRKTYLRRTAYAVAGVVMAVSAYWAFNFWRMT